MNKVNILGLNFKVGDELQNIINLKFNKLFSHNSHILSASVELEKIDSHKHENEFLCKGHLELKGKNIIISSRHENVFKSVELLINKLDRGLRRRSRMKKVKRKMGLENAGK